MALKEHLKENTVALVHASEVLMDNNLYEEVIELLEPKLLTITSVDNIIAQGMYNLGSSYMSIGNYNKAEQYLVNSSAGLPKNDLDLIMNLHNIYIAADKIAEVKELLINISSKDIKDYLTISLDIDKIIPKKLATINKKNLPFNLLQNYKYYEYIAKYNNYSNSEKEKQQKQLTNDFKKIISSTNANKAFVLSVALYTKQNEIALDILKELPKGFFETFPNLIRLKALLDPTSILSLQEKYGDIDNEENVAIFKIACNSLIIENRTELLTKVFEAQKQNDGISNELLFEVKFVVALLGGNKAEAKE